MSELAVQDSTLSVAEAVKLGAVDTGLFGQIFFPKACRQKAPPFHQEMYANADDPSKRYLSHLVFRDGAKTTAARIIVAKRISYAISRTNLIVGKSAGAAAKTLQWVRNAIDYNTFWAQTFGLRRGARWSDDWIEVINEVDEVAINLVAIGITGSTRGVNLDDYRPDFILVDDPCDEENTGTPEQRKKTAELFFGSLANSLAPEVDCAWAKMMLLQTLLNPEDLVSMTVRDPQWHSVINSCFDDNGRSVWPERYPTETLQREKAGYISRGQAALWYREKECRIVSSEDTTFRPVWYTERQTYPQHGRTIIAVDPTPPPKGGTQNSNFRNLRLDDAVVTALRLFDGHVYQLDGYSTKSPLTSELITVMMDMAVRWKASTIAVETVLFARTIAEYLRKEMIERRQFFAIMEIEDKRNKRQRIEQEMAKYASLGLLHFMPNNPIQRDQFEMFPDVNHDDWLDAWSIGLMALFPSRFDPANSSDGVTIDGEYSEAPPPLESFRSCP